MAGSLRWLAAVAALAGAVGCRDREPARGLGEPAPADDAVAPAPPTVALRGCETPPKPAVPRVRVEPPEVRGAGTTIHAPEAEPAIEAPGARVGVGRLSIRGNLDATVARRYVRRQQARFADCYRRALAEAPELGGGKTIAFVLTKLGRIENVRVTGFESDALDACLVKATKAMKLPRPEAGLNEIRIPLGLSPADPPPPAVAARAIADASLDLAACYAEHPDERGALVADLVVLLGHEPVGVVRELELTGAGGPGWPCVEQRLRALELPPGATGRIRCTFELSER